MHHTLTRHDLADIIERHASAMARELREDPRDGALVVRPDAPNQPLSPESKSPIGDPEVSAPSPAALRTWLKVGELADQSYAWPAGVEHYQPFEVWQASALAAQVQIGIGDPNNPSKYYGKVRGYRLTFEMVNGQKRRPIVVFTEADDFEETGDLVAIIKGKGEGGRSMFAPGDDLPPGYEDLEIAVFRDRINGPQAFNRLVVVARGGSPNAMCTHAFLQLGLRS